MRRISVGVIALTLGACATPGLDYTARVPAASQAASEYRHVSVEGFRGPSGGWFSRRFAGMLDNVTFDGQPWFQTSIAYGETQEKSGFYTGHVSVDHVDEDEYYRTVKKCVEWDGLFDCERREEVEQLCIDTRVDVSVHTELIDELTGQSIYQSRHSGSASDRDCYDVKAYAGHRVHSYSYSSFGRHNAPDFLIREALSDTFYSIRREIAPANVKARATLITEALDPEVRADPRFQQSVDAAKDGNVQAACQGWTALAAEFPNAPGVTHNFGACSEAMGDFAGAQVIYARAAEMVASAVDGDANKTIINALERVSTRRVDSGLLAELIGREPEGPVPYSDELEDVGVSPEAAPET